MACPKPILYANQEWAGPVAGKPRKLAPLKASSTTPLDRKHLAKVARTTYQQAQRLPTTHREQTQPAQAAPYRLSLPANTIVDDALHLGKHARLNLACRPYSPYNDLPFVQLPQQHVLHSLDNAAS